MKAMVLCSGGVDSTTCLGMAVDKYGAENVIALSIYYGQKHTKEIECAKKVTQHYQVEHLSLDLEKIFQYSDCSLLSHSDKDKRYTGIDIRAVPQWTVFIQCGKHCTVKGL